MKLEELGYNNILEKFKVEHNLDREEIGRVIAEHKERYVVKTTRGEFISEVTGNMRFTARSREDFPAVGDWVVVNTFDSDYAIIYKIFPRFSIVKRQAVGQPGEIQIMATNIEYAFIVQALDRDFNINRLERYLTICHASEISPIIILTKTDLISEHRKSEILERIELRIKNIPVIAVSNMTQTGYEELKKVFEKGKTYCLLGSSGVGKSTLLNNLSDSALMRTDTISQSTNKGRHITTHRELIILENGGILIDNPGLREVGIADAASGLETTFDLIADYSQKCKFKDCTHTNEIGCAVRDAVAQGKIDSNSYENFLKMEREKTYFESTVAERRKKEKKFGKMIKNYKKDMNKNK